MSSKRPPSATSEPEECPPLKVVKLTSAAIEPRRATPGAAGYDLCASEETTVVAGTRKMVKTDLAVQVPPKTYARIAPRSGLAHSRGIDTGAGVIDPVSLPFRLPSVTAVTAVTAVTTVTRDRALLLHRTTAVP